MTKNSIQKGWIFCYSHVDDIDVFVGGMLETHVVGGAVGPTFACIIGKQFKGAKFADRFWFERCKGQTKEESGFSYSKAVLKQLEYYWILCLNY